MRHNPAKRSLIVGALLGALGGCGPSAPVEPPVVDPDPVPTVPTSPTTPSTPSTPSLPASHIYIANADGTGIARLTIGDYPAWSPDGRRVVFQRDGQVRVINLDGSGDTPIAAGSAPAWSPDGTTIAYTSADGISLVSPAGVPLGIVVRHDHRDDTDRASDMGVSKAAWSPDGRAIAFEHLGDGDMAPAQVFVVGLNESTPKLLTQDPRRIRYAESDPSWSPDGSRVVHWSYGYGIAATAAAGGVPNTIYSAFPRAAYGTKPVWSARGIVAFTMDLVWSTRPSIWTIPASDNTGAARLLIDNAFNAAWSPTGGRIAFVRRR